MARFERLCSCGDDACAKYTTGSMLGIYKVLYRAYYGGDIAVYTGPMLGILYTSYGMGFVISM